MLSLFLNTFFNSPFQSCLLLISPFILIFFFPSFHSLLILCMCVVVVGGLVIQSCLTIVTPPSSSVHRIFRQEFWSGLPFPSPGDLPDPRIKPMFPTLQAVSYIPNGFFTTQIPGKPHVCVHACIYISFNFLKLSTIFLLIVVILKKMSHIQHRQICKTFFMISSQIRAYSDTYI